MGNAEKIASIELAKFYDVEPSEVSSRMSGLHTMLSRVIQEAEERGLARAKAEQVDGGPLPDPNDAIVQRDVAWATALMLAGFNALSLTPDDVDGAVEQFEREVRDDRDTDWSNALRAAGHGFDCVVYTDRPHSVAAVIGTHRAHAVQRAKDQMTIDWLSRQALFGRRLRKQAQVASHIACEIFERDEEDVPTADQADSRQVPSGFECCPA